MATMQRIAADFNNLGLEDEESLLPLGADDSMNLRGHTLRDGERAIFFEDGGLEAEGVLQSRKRQSDDKTFWYAHLDLATMKELDPTPFLRVAAAEEPADSAGIVGLSFVPYLTQPVENDVAHADQFVREIRQVLRAQLRVANGDLRARVTLSEGDMLWPTAVLLNQTIARLEYLTQLEHRQHQMEEALLDLVAALNSTPAGREPDWPKPSGTLVDSIVEAIDRGLKGDARSAKSGKGTTK